MLVLDLSFDVITAAAGVGNYAIVENNLCTHCEFWILPASTVSAGGLRGSVIRLRIFLIWSDTITKQEAVTLLLAICPFVSIVHGRSSIYFVLSSIGSLDSHIFWGLSAVNKCRRTVRLWTVVYENLTSFILRVDTRVYIIALSHGSFGKWDWKTFVSFNWSIKPQ